MALAEKHTLVLDPAGRYQPRAPAERARIKLDVHVHEWPEPRARLALLHGAWNFRERLTCNSEAVTLGYNRKLPFENSVAMKDPSTKKTSLVNEFRVGSIRRCRVMMFVAFGVAAGVLCAFLRYPPISLAAICALLAVGAVLTGNVLGTHPGVIAVEVFGSIAVPQFTFVAVSLTNHLTRRTRLIPQVRAAIGQQLRAELEVPRDLPPDLAALVTQLSHA